MHGEDIGATVCIGERDRDGHLAAQRGICSLKLVHFDNLLIRHELHETAMVRIGVRGRLTHSGRRVIRERDPDRATFAGFELMHVAGHAGRHLPLNDGFRIDKCAVDSCALRVYVLADAGRVYAHNFLWRQIQSYFGS